MRARNIGLGVSEHGSFLLGLWIYEGRPPWTGQRGRVVLLAFDMPLEVGDNKERQGCYPWGYRGDVAKAHCFPVAAPMSGVVVMQEAIGLLIVETKQTHPWPGRPGGVSSTSSPCGDTHSPVCLQPWRLMRSTESGATWHVECQ